MDYTTLIVFVGVLAVAVAAPQTAPPDTSASGTAEPEVRVLSRKFRTDQLGNYVYGYKQSNGQIVKEVGHVPHGPEPSAVSLTQQGEFQFISEDGQTYQLSYVADEKGFQPQGIHLPQPPAQIPEYAQLRIDYPQLFWAEDSSL